jgi:hypothetical protein
MRMRRMGLAALATAIALTAFTGCGDDGGTTRTPAPASGTHDTVDPAALKAVTAGSKRITEAGSAHFTLDGDITIEGRAIPMRSTGNMTTGSRSVGRLDMTMRVPGDDGADTEVDVETRIIGSEVYMRMPDEMVADAARPWLRMTMPVEMMQASDPSFQARIMSHATGARKVGTEKVDGVPTTRYRVTVDYGELARSGPPPLRKLARTVLKTTQPRQTSEMWIDGDGVPRRIRCRVATKTSAAGATVDIRVDDLGVPVHVEAPPADQVTDADAAATDPA